MTIESLADAPRHLFDDRLNSLLGEAGFDSFVDTVCCTIRRAVQRRFLRGGAFECCLSITSQASIHSEVLRGNVQAVFRSFVVGQDLFDRAFGFVWQYDLSRYVEPSRFLCV